jgi:hypothetical protein
MHKGLHISTTVGAILIMLCVGWCSFKNIVESTLRIHLYLFNKLTY